MQKVTTINALAELDRIGWEYEPAGDDEVKVRCPAHDDKEPSASLNVDSNKWICYGCKVKGDIISFLAYAMSVERKTMIVELSKRYELDEIKQISVRTVEAFHKEIWTAGPLLKELYKRGITDDMIRTARIGYHKGRITIPVYDAQLRCVNIRRYLPGAEKKYINTRGYGRAALYQVNQLEHERVWVCGGELKALAVGALLENIGAVSSTGGEGSWENAWLDLFKDKIVYICMDIDNAGKAAAKKLAALLVGVAREVRIIALALDKEKYPKGDVSDFIMEGGSLVRSMELAPLYEGIYSAEEERGSKVVKLVNACDPRNMGWRLELTGVVSAQDSTPYLVPKEIDVGCTRDQPHCHTCPISNMESDEGGFARATIPAASEAVLEMVGATKRTLPAAILSGLQIPPCKAVEFRTKSQHIVWDVRLSPQLEMSGDQGGNIAQPALVVGSTVDLNTPYKLQGKTYPHPKHQQATLVLDEAEVTEDNLSTFSLTDKDREHLEIFKPRDESLEALEEKLDEIYGDLENNVTQIYGRRDLHIAIDLAYHSPLFLELDDKRVNGWLQVLVVGDSAQGKSETCIQLQQHYGIGEKVECKNATVAGLLGGLQQLGTRWFVSWGVIPTHDRRLVILEELKGASTEVIGRLTDMRSTGMAEIPKIERRRAHARTRLIALSNPRGNRAVATYGFGLAAIQELIGALEDVRRFDVALILQAGEVSVEEMQKKTVPHKFTGDLCRKLVLAAWTGDTIKFDDVEYLDAECKRLCEKFSEALPLIDRGTIRHKIARMSAALAARTFSRVTRAHIEYITRWLDNLYSAKGFGYLDFSRAQKRAVGMKDPEIVTRYLEATKHPAHLISEILYRDDISLQDVQDWCEIERDDAQVVISFLVRHHAIRRRKLTYHKTADFIALLKGLEGKQPIETEIDKF